MSLLWRTWNAWSRWWNLTPAEKLFIAASRNRLAEVEALMYGQTLDYLWEGYSPLMIAARQGHFDVAELLLRAGADPNFATSQGLTAVRLAVQNGYYLLVQLLIGYRAEARPDLITDLLRGTPHSHPKQLYQDTDGYWTSLPSSPEKDMSLCLSSLVQAGVRIKPEDIDYILTSLSAFSFVLSALAAEQLFDLIPATYLRTKYQFREYLRRGYNIDQGLPINPPLSLFCFLLGQGLVCSFDLEQPYHRLALVIHGGQVSRDHLPKGDLVPIMEDLAQHKLELISLDPAGNNRLGQVVLHASASPEEKIIVLEMLLARHLDASHENRLGFTALQLVQKTAQHQLLEVFL